MHINEHEHLGPSCECTRFRPTGWFSLAGWRLIQTIKRNIQFHTFVIVIIWPWLLNLSDSAFFKWNCFKRYSLFADITFTLLLLLLKCIGMRLHFKLWFFYCQTWTPSWWAGSPERIESRDLPMNTLVKRVYTHDIYMQWNPQTDRNQGLCGSWSVAYSLLSCLGASGSSSHVCVKNCGSVRFYLDMEHVYILTYFRNVFSLKVPHAAF